MYDDVTHTQAAARAMDGLADSDENRSHGRDSLQQTLIAMRVSTEAEALPSESMSRCASAPVQSSLGEAPGSPAREYVDPLGCLNCSGT
jgi:hypothetical protein